MTDLTTRLRDPVLMKRWWDQYGMEAADRIEQLERQVDRLRYVLNTGIHEDGWIRVGIATATAALEESQP